jgi:hypothetical protein
MKIMFLPIHTISLTQPRDWAVIYTFQKLYQKLPFNVAFVTVNNPFHDFWKFYTIMHSIINILAVRAIIKESTLAGVWGKMWPKFMHNSGGFEKPAVEHNVKETDDAEFMALEKQLGGKSLKDFHSDATMKLITPTVMSAGDLVEQMTTNTQRVKKMSLNWYIC